MYSITDIFGAEGLFMRHLDDFVPREQQIQMASAISDVIADKDVLIAEAGTGTGKTYAYLVPIILSGEKTIISTGTKTLQEQLYHRDLPRVLKIMQSPAHTALLKGRANYLCHYRLNRQVSSGRLPANEQHKLSQLYAWKNVTQSGDRAEMTFIQEDDAIWASVTSTTENCLGGECPDYSECFVLKARKKAMDADILVINHYLFFADMALKDEGFGEVLPGAHSFIFDEAHQLPDIAVQFFGVRISAKQLLELAKDVTVEVLSYARDAVNISELCQSLEKHVNEFRLSINNTDNRGSWSKITSMIEIKLSFERLLTSLMQLKQELEEHAARSAGLDKCWRRSVELFNQLQLFDDTEVTATAEAEYSDVGEEVMLSPPNVRWYELQPRGFVLHQTPTSVSRPFGEYVHAHDTSWIFTSATLAVGNNFSHFTDQLGLNDAETRCWESPFNYRDQTLLYIPKSLPAPGDQHYTEAVIDNAVPVIEACHGRTFFLVTSYRALKIAADRLAKEIDFPVLIQGEKPKTELLDNFRAQGNAVLIGTYSFWEGVDVKGDALSCVIIDKLPFAAPDDPILQAKSEWMKVCGDNPFYKLQIPQAVINLKQGVGRLIRDSFDRGIIMLCDPRIINKGYGKIFLRNLPDMKLTHQLQDVYEFLQ